MAKQRKPKRSKTIDSNTELSQKDKESLSELKRLLQYKYGGVVKFSQASGYSYNKLLCLVYGKLKEPNFSNTLNEVVEMIKKTDTPPEQTRIEVLDYETRIWLKMRLYAKFKNAVKFSQAFPEFSPSYLHHVFYGRKKNKCKKINRLIQIVNSQELIDMYGVK